ncbi:hypothetical protein DCS_00648 [Drechmeria coniospora]|uniref:Regulator of phospholipase D SRF1 n=1 Tax=Drechmeria coniospora TaxID=98403 RepID=A0A151GR27_DRECN|nr:hypothetical protein DCS_00648 [Drechmeria coniospora]KYK59518.1 hypothetical protein DCS_00648 [Drechmeria coniospora]
MAQTAMPASPSARAPSVEARGETNGARIEETGGQTGVETSRRCSYPRPPSRTIPAWIASYEKGDGPVDEYQLQLLGRPASAVPAQHSGTPNPVRRRVSKDGYVWEEGKQPQETRSMIPHFLQHGRASKKGRRWDHLRSAEPVIVSAYTGWHNTRAAAIRDFARSSSYAPTPGEKSRVVTKEELDKLMPSYGRPSGSRVRHYDAEATRGRRPKAFYERAWNRMLRSALSPLLFRLAVMITSILALGIASRIFQLEDSDDKESAERTQSVVAVTVDCVAIPYTCYMVWDEYTGKPIGLRSASSKTRLILLDLFFIIFKSASTALAFESLVFHNVMETNLLYLSAALGAFELLGLISWTLNFTVNIFRTVEKMGGGRDGTGGGGGGG